MIKSSTNNGGKIGSLHVKVRRSNASTLYLYKNQLIVDPGPKPKILNHQTTKGKCEAQCKTLV